MVQTAIPLGPASPDDTVAVRVSVTDSCVTWSLGHKDVATRHWHPRGAICELCPDVRMWFCLVPLES